MICPLGDPCVLLKNPYNGFIWAICAQPLGVSCREHVLRTRAILQKLKTVSVVFFALVASVTLISILAVAEDAPPPVSLSLEVTPAVVEASRPVTVTATLTAKQPVTLCLLKDSAPQFAFDLEGSLGDLVSLMPVMATLPDGERISPYRKTGVYERLIALKNGDSFDIRVNLSRQLKHTRLRAGEYLLSGEFALCDQTMFANDAGTGYQRVKKLMNYPGKAMQIKADRDARFYQSN